MPTVSIILRLLDTILLLIPKGVALHARFQVTRDEIAAMGTEHPTDEQWERTGANADATLGRLRPKRKP